MLTYSKRLVIAAVAPSLLLIITLVVRDGISIPAAAITSLLIIGGCIWLAHQMERQVEFTLLSNTGRPAGVEEQILNALSEPVIILDGSRSILLANEAAHNTLGVTQVGRDLSLGLRHPTVLDAVDTALANNRVESVEVSFHGNVSRTFRAHVTVVPGEGQKDGRRVVLFLQDVTALKRADIVRADFVANVSHELRSPLAALVGFIETLQGSARDDAEAQNRFLNIMQTEAQRMTRLIVDLLSLSAVESNEHVPPEGEVDVMPAVRSVVDTLSSQLNENENPIELDFPETLPTVLGDRDELTQVFLNLLDNAMKYGGPDKPIHVSAKLVERIPETGGPGVSIAFKDMGEGINPEQLPRLTARFFRVDKGRSRALGGTGLGLAIVKHIVSRHRGHFAIESTPQQSSTFTVTLPLFDKNSSSVSNS